MFQHRWLPHLVGLAVLASTLLGTNLAAAQSAVYVLGIRSVEGDDAFARELTGAVRDAASSIEGWNVAADEISLSQMTMLHGCDEPNVDCMRAIAGELSADKIIYATLRRAGSGEDFDFNLSLYLFSDGTIAERLNDTIPRSDIDSAQLRERAERYAAQLSGQARFGSLRLEVGEAAANVSIDGNPVGMTNAAGSLFVEDLSEGSHDIDVNADGFEPLSTNVNIQADQTNEVLVNLTRPGEGGGANLGWIPGAVLTAAGVAMIVGGAIAGGRSLKWKSERSEVENFLAANSANEAALINCVTTNDPLQENETHQCTGADGDAFEITRVQGLLVLASNEADACDNPAPGWQADTCDQTTRNNRIQWGMFAGGIVATGVGVVLLMRYLGRDDDEESADNVQVTPYASQTESGLNMSMTF